MTLGQNVASCLLRVLTALGNGAYDRKNGGTDLIKAAANESCHAGPAAVVAARERALAKAAGRNYSNVHADIAALELALVARDAQGAVHVPFDAVEIQVKLAVAA